MRGALAALTAVALGGLYTVTASDAATVRYASAQAALAEVDGKTFGAVSVRREGSDAATLTLAKGRVSVGAGSSSVTASGEDGTAEATVRDVSLLGDRVLVRSLTRSTDGEQTRGEVVGLRVDGRRYGVIRQPRTIDLGIGQRLVLNDGANGLRLVTEGLEVKLAVVGVSSFTRELPDPTPTPKPKPEQSKKASPTPTPRPPRTPPRLTAGGYAFPVVGEVSYSDTFGAERQVPIVTHQGVDIFGEFGAPVVAVRDGRLTKVGTLDISGNRLWVIADNGDAFFYAHLSSFSNAARTGARVQAGDVLGFVGNTGDAEPTPPHLHFEVHPGGMNEDAVNPYPIVRAWEESEDVPPGAWVQRLGAEASERPGALVTVRDFIAE